MRVADSFGASQLDRLDLSQGYTDGGLSCELEIYLYDSRDGTMIEFQRRCGDGLVLSVSVSGVDLRMTAHLVALIAFGLLVHGHAVARGERHGVDLGCVVLVRGVRVRLSLRLNVGTGREGTCMSSLRSESSAARRSFFALSLASSSSHARWAYGVA